MNDKLRVWRIPAKYVPYVSKTFNRSSFLRCVSVVAAEEGFVLLSFVGSCPFLEIEVVEKVPNLIPDVGWPDVTDPVSEFARVGDLCSTGCGKPVEASGYELCYKCWWHQDPRNTHKKDQA